MLEAVYDEVEGRLTQSLHNAVLINLGKEAQPQQVRRPWDAEVKIGRQMAEALPKNSTIATVFDRSDIARKLLILGAPGSGKTTTMLDLAQSLVQSALADKHAAIPVLLNLSSWRKTDQSIAAWFQEELRLKYGVSAKLGSQWIQEKKLLPLLDGLDEVAAERQETCVNAINQFLSGEQRPVAVVVCSREEEYNLYRSNLALNGAIRLKPLTPEQMQDFLHRLGQRPLADTLHQDTHLQELLQAPLLLSMAVLALQTSSIQDWQQLSTAQNRLDWLLEHYVLSRLQMEYRGNTYPPQKVPTPRQTRHWLRWLAQLMAQQSQTEFLIENLQPDETLHKKTYRGLYGLIVGVIVGLIFGLIYGLIVGLIVGLIAGLIPGNIYPVEAFQISWTREALQEMGRGLIVGLIYGLIGGLTRGLIGGLIVGLIFGLIGGLIRGLIGGLIGGLKTNIQTRVTPNQGIKASLKNALMLGTIALVLSFGIYILGTIAFTYLPLPDSVTPQSIIAASTALVMWFCITEGGLDPAIKHFALRVVLCRNGFMPWDYARFLNFCTETLLLQRVGGRYRFIHKLVQDYFAVALP